MEVLQHIPKIITDDHNFMLMKPIDLEEVEMVVKKITVDNAPGLDGFTTSFFYYSED